MAPQPFLESVFVHCVYGPDDTAGSKLRGISGGILAAKEIMQSINTTKRPRVLVLRLSSLGDVVHCTASARLLLQANCECVFVTKKIYAEMLQSTNSGITTYVYDKQASGGESKAREAFFEWVKSQEIDLILDLHDSMRTRFWRGFLRSRAKVFVAHKPRWRELLTLLLRFGRYVGLGAGGRARLYYDTTLRGLTYLADTQGIEIPVDQHPGWTMLESPKDLRTEIKDRLPTQNFLVIVPGSAWRGKRWPDDYFTKLARNFAKTAPVVVLGAKHETFCDQIAEAAREVNSNSISLRGELNLSECASVLARANLIVGNDTGLVHMAEALGKKVVVIEGPTSDSLGFSVHRESSRIEALDLWCRPCSKSGRICIRWASRKCLNGLSVERLSNSLSEAWG